MKNTKSNPIGAFCAVITLIIIQLSARHCMRKYTRG